MVIDPNQVCRLNLHFIQYSKYDFDFLKTYSPSKRDCVIPGTYLYTKGTKEIELSEMIIFIEFFLTTDQMSLRLSELFQLKIWLCLRSGLGH